jgi:hypothetical protein
MSHSSHSFEFFHKSLFSFPVVTTVNCVMFDALSHLSGANADLCFATKRCFICRIATHRIDSCPQCSLGMLLCKQLDDGHSTSFLGVDE